MYDGRLLHICVAVSSMGYVEIYWLKYNGHSHPYCVYAILINSLGPFAEVFCNYLPHVVEINAHVIILC